MRAQVGESPAATHALCQERRATADATKSEVQANMQVQLTDIDSRAGGGSPLVSVVMCVYNAGQYLRPAVLSVVNQTHRNLDIIIVDDGSTDDCFDTITDLLDDERIRVVRQANATRPVALNRALDLVQGEFYAIQDADDISEPTRIQKQLDAMLPREELAAVFCGYWLHMGEKRIAPEMTPKTEAECEADIDAFRVPAHDATGLFRVSMVRNLRYDASLPFVEAVDYILRVGENHPMVVLGDCLYGYRLHADSLTQSDPQRRDRMVTTMLERAYRRRGRSFDTTFSQARQRKYRSPNSVADNNIASVFVTSVLSQRQAKRRWGAVNTGLQCARLHPLDPYYYKALAYAVVPAELLRLIRSTPRRLRALRPSTRVTSVGSGALRGVRERQRAGAALGAAVAAGPVGRLLAVATVQLLPVKRRVAPDIPLPVRMDLPTGSRWFWFRDASELIALCEIFGEGEYEVVGHGDPRLIVDLGANAGQAALWLRCRFPKARIISVEPDPRTFATLTRNHRRDPMIRLAQVAIAGSDDLYGLARDDDSSWGTRLVADGRGDVDHVHAVRLETLMLQHEIEWIDLLKVDIEGMEHEALGRCAALRRAGRVIGEIHADLISVPVDRALEDMRHSGGFDTAVLHGDIFVLERAGPPGA